MKSPDLSIPTNLPVHLSIPPHPNDFLIWGEFHLETSQQPQCYHIILAFLILFNMIDSFLNIFCISMSLFPFPLSHFLEQLELLWKDHDHATVGITLQHNQTMDSRVVFLPSPSFLSSSVIHLLSCSTAIPESLPPLLTESSSLILNYSLSFFKKSNLVSFVVSHM